MEEPRLRALAVVGAGAHAAAGRHADDDVGLLAPAPVDFGQVVDDLVESTGHKIAELHFHHGLLAGDGQSKGGSHDGRFAEWRVAHAFLAKGVHKTVGHLEHPAVGADVLAHEHEVRMFFHAQAQPFGDGVDEPHVPLASFRSVGQTVGRARGKPVVQFFPSVGLHHGL